MAVARPREALDRRIAERVRRELDEGLVAELEAALDTPGVAREPLQVIGAREVAAIRAGELDASELPERLAARTRRLARKQLTWLRKEPGVVPLDLGDAPAEDALRGPAGAVEGRRGGSGNLRRMRFAKWQGLGNDYLIVETADWPLALTPARARRICDRHFGVGADGILELTDEGGHAAHDRVERRREPGRELRQRHPDGRAAPAGAGAAAGRRAHPDRRRAGRRCARPAATGWRCAWGGRASPPARCASA